MISLTRVSKGYGERVLFRDVNLTIGVSERIGLVGPNGAGKSTLLFLLAGRLEPDDGQVSRNRRASVGLLLQEAPSSADRTVLEEMLAGHEGLRHLEHRLSLIEEEMRATREPAALETLAAEHGELQARFAAGGGYDLPTTAKKILGGLAFRDEDFERPTSEFSGGWLMRLALGRLLLTEPDLLLLDEPTNYLDLESVIWLESYLRQYEGSLVIASHDRALLDRLSTRIVEIDGGRVTSYTGNYEAYVRARRLREEGLEATRKAQEREIAHTQKFIDRFRYKASKARQVQSRIKKLEKIERVEGPGKRRTLRFHFPEPPPCGRIVLELRQVWQSYGGPPVYAGLDLVIERGDRIALVGPNGAGKSTLLKLLAGHLAPDRGERRVDPRASIAYFAQRQVEALDHGRSAYAEVAAAAPELVPEQVRGLLGRFLFSGDDAFKTIGVLSGGEKSRVALAKLLVHPPNLLLLDEPTSHLDIPSRDVLEEALADYPGALVTISHDRHFLAAIANRVLEVGGGTVRSHLGTYDEFLERRERDGTSGAGVPGATKGAAAPSHRTREDRRREAEARQRRHRALGPKRRERDGLEAEIETMGARLAGLEAEMAHPDFYRESARFEETFRAYRALKAEIDAKTERWAHVARELEQLESENAGADESPHSR